jgi:type I restriction enzyme R subunit
VLVRRFVREVGRRGQHSRQQKCRIDRGQLTLPNTSSGLFDLERGVPTDAYDLDDAVNDKFLVPPKAVSVPLKFQREGIKYDDLSEDEKEQWDAVEWDDDGRAPIRVEAEAVNKWLFNKDTVDKVLEHLMTRGLTVAGGDRLGKTIIFAKNHAHAEFIAQRFDINYPHYKGAFARVIDFEVKYAQSLIDDFSNLAKPPHIAISVDMLDTGIDVPEVVNLVFFKLVRSKTKFWQMLGRGTRLCPDLFGPGKDKEFFYIFDYCQNLEFFSQNPETTPGVLGESLSKRLFKMRLELIGQLDAITGQQTSGESAACTEALSGVRREATELLRSEVAAMNLDNFVVRPQRRLVEKYGKAEAWETLSCDEQEELAHQVAGLPSELASEEEEAKRFDLLMLNLELAMLRAEPAFVRLRDQVQEIAGLLEEKASIPMVREQLALILDVQTDIWWQDATVPMLESVRKHLRALVKLIDKQKRKPIYTDFEDRLGDETAVELPGFVAADQFERFKAKARSFLKEHRDHATIRKLRLNRPLTTADLEALEQMLLAEGIGSREDVRRAKEEAEGLGLFVRSLVGLDREAAKEAFATFLGGKTFTANQIEFVNLIINHLTEHGCMDPATLYESPYTDYHPQGVDGLFSSTQAGELVAVLEDVRRHAGS